MSATILFPIGAVGISILSYLYPALLADYKVAIILLLGLVMLGMGMTLRPENFLGIVKRPKVIAIGVGLKFFLIPCVAFFVSTLSGLQQVLVVGLVLVGSCPGEKASLFNCL